MTESRGFRLQAEDLLLWQLADSAFPTGSFAHSWGLEAAWQSGEVPDLRALNQFVLDTLEQAGRTVLPLLTAAHRHPARVRELDEIADAFLTNPVANRASRAQGRAFSATCARVWPGPAVSAVDADVREACGHAGPAMGAMLATLGVPAEAAHHLCLYGAARGVLAAAVRLGVAGSYDAQRLQHGVAGAILDVAARCGGLDDRDLAQTAPLLDLLQAAHDRLYSRLFQS
jgi:urease accessory protein